MAMLAGQASAEEVSSFGHLEKLCAELACARGADVLLGHTYIYTHIDYIYMYIYVYTYIKIFYLQYCIIYNLYDREKDAKHHGH